MANLIFKKVNIGNSFYSVFFKGNSSIMFIQSNFWHSDEVFFLGGGEERRWGILKIICTICPQCIEFLVVAHKNKPRATRSMKILCTRLKSEWKFLISISIIIIIIMKQIAEKILFPAFMSKIIIINPIQVSVPRATPWKINWATTYGKLMIIYSRR